MKNWTADIGDDKRGVSFSIAPDIAEQIAAAINNDRQVEGPRHARDFDGLIATIAQTSRLIHHLEAFRELAIVAADETSPHADRQAIAIAATMPPSRLYRLLERYGRPRNRRSATS